MLIESKGFYIGNHYVPPFSLEKGEILIIDINKETSFCELEILVADFLSEKKTDENIIINTPFLFTGRIWSESWLKSIFNPTTIRQYIKQYTSDYIGIIEKINNLDSSYVELGHLKAEDKISSLEATPFRLISIFSVLAKSKYIITDLMGQSIQGLKLTWSIINANVENEGCCIIFDRDGYSGFTKFAKRFKRIEI